MSESPAVEEVPPAEAFAALADPTRIAILRALWEADDHTATFSELRAAVEMDDSGRFNYHLSKLRGRFISHTDDGYRLRLAGTRVVGALLSGAYTQTGSVDPVAMDQSCPLCDGPLTFHYEDEQVVIDCDDCGQTLMGFSVPPGVFAGHDHEILPDITERYARNLIRQIRTGFCMTCEGRVHPRVTVETPPSDTECLPPIPMVQYECERCGETISSDLGTAFLDHPDVVAFYHDHGIDVRETPIWRFVAVDEDGVRVLEEDPLRMNVIHTADDDRLTLTVDRSLDVLSIEHNR